MVFGRSGTSPGRSPRCSKRACRLVLSANAAKERRPAAARWSFVWEMAVSGRNIRTIFPVRRRSRGRGQLASKYRAGCRARKHHVACVPPLAGPAMPGSAVPAAGGLAMYRPQPRVKFASASGISASASTATWARTTSARLAWTRPHGPLLTKTAVSPAFTAGSTSLSSLSPT
jgi:hypothetical protein